jgi:hypothetical protein
MLHAPIISNARSPLDMPSLLEVLARSSSRPRYAFMVLNLIAQVARPDGRAGPLVAKAGGLIPLRDWLCDALTPMGQRDPRRIALERRIRAELDNSGKLPTDLEQATAAVEDAIRLQVRVSGKTNVSRAVSELVRAGLLQRHYQGYCVDHHNRGAQRQAVYILAGGARSLVAGAPSKPTAVPRQAELVLMPVENGQI